MKEVTVVGETYIPESETRLKGKLNNNMDIVVSFIKPFPKLEDLVKLTVSFSAKNFIGDDRALKSGVKLDINIWFDIFKQDIRIKLLKWISM